jgi:hypothetical protein
MTAASQRIVIWVGGSGKPSAKSTAVQLSILVRIAKNEEY